MTHNWGERGGIFLHKEKYSKECQYWFLSKDLFVHLILQLTSKESKVSAFSFYYISNIK